MLSFVLRNRYGLINLALWLLFGWLLYLVGRWVFPYITPLIIGLIIAILIEPIVKLLTRIKLPRWLASLLTLLIFFGGGATLLFLLAAKMTLELLDFSKQAPTMISGFVDKGQVLLDRAVAFYGTLSPTMSSEVQKNLSDVSNYLTGVGKTTATSVINALSQVPSLLTIFLLALLISFFLSKDFPKWQRRLFRLIKPSIREKSDVVLEDLGKATFGYMRAQAILIFITFLVSLAGLLVLDIPYAFSLSILAGLLDLLPVLGTGSLFIPWGAYQLLVGDTRIGIGLFIVYGVGLLLRQILEPKILAEQIGSNPLITLVMMYAGYQAIGFLGVILAPFVIITVTSMMKVHAFDFLIDQEIDHEHHPDPHDHNPPRQKD